MATMPVLSKPIIFLGKDVLIKGEVQSWPLPEQNCQHPLKYLLESLIGVFNRALSIYANTCYIIELAMHVCMPKGRQWVHELGEVIDFIGNCK